MGGSYRDLKVWQKAIELVDEIYRGTQCFPTEERYGLTSQLRRAAVSVPSNIAEGKGRNSDKELVVFLHHARGSVFEVETQLVLAARLGYLSEKNREKLEGLAGEVARMLNGLIDRMKGTNRHPELVSADARRLTPD